jgi:hypothetical protein
MSWSRRWGSTEENERLEDGKKRRRRRLCA